VEVRVVDTHTAVTAATATVKVRVVDTAVTAAVAMVEVRVVDTAMVEVRVVDTAVMTAAMVEVRVVDTTATTAALAVAGAEATCSSTRHAGVSMCMRWVRGQGGCMVQGQKAHPSNVETICPKAGRRCEPARTRFERAPPGL
jgi:hypothetical protein